MTLPARAATAKRRTVFHRIVWLVAAVCTSVLAQDYPAKPAKIIMPYPPGGQPDIVVRLIAQQFTTQLGQPFQVEHLPGSGGMVATASLLRQPTDGYTIAYADAGSWAIYPAMNPKVEYDPLKDFAPIGLFAQSGGMFLVVNTSQSLGTLKDLMTQAKAKPGSLSYASAGIGTIHHLIMEDFKATFGLDILHVPYKGALQAIPALASGQVSMAIGAPSSVASYVKEGRFRVLATSAKERNPLAPDVPTIGESTGRPDFDHTGFMGMVARAGTPRAVIDKLSGAMARAIAVPEVATRFTSVGLEPVADARPEAAMEQMRKDFARYTRIVKTAGIKAE
jgi:tripartite-type tricarboxylate transporter receptor subunit TctC